MNAFKKSLTLLSIFMLFLVIPCNTVFAEGEEDAPLGEGEIQPQGILIAYDCQTLDKTKNILFEYVYEDSTLSQKYCTFDHTNLNGIVEIKSEDISDSQQTKINEFNSKVSVEYDEVNTCFTLKVKDGKELNIIGFKNQKISSLIYCSCDLKIVGNGTINVTLVPQPEPEPPDDEVVPVRPTFNSAAATINALILSDNKISIGDDNSSLKMKIGTSIPSDCNNGITGDICGIQANKISIKKTYLDIKTRNFAFASTLMDDLVEEEDILLIDNSTVIFNNEIINSFDVRQRKCAFFISNVEKANVTVKDSTLQIKIKDPLDSENNELVEEGSVINLSPNSSFNLMHSTLDYYSNAMTSLCSAPVINIKDGSTIKCINDKYGYIFDVDKFHLTDSNFYIKSKGVNAEEKEHIFAVYTVPVSFQAFGKDINYSTEIIITENSSNYTGTMSIDSTDENDRVFPKPSNQSHKLSAPAEEPVHRDTPYDRIIISSNSDDLLKSLSIGSGSESEKNSNYVWKEDEGLYVFEFINRLSDPDLLKWKSFELTHTPKPEPSHHSSKHEVLNTGVY